MTEYIAVVARGVESLLDEELRVLGATPTKVDRGAVRFEATLAVAYRVLLSSRLASRILLPVARFDEGSFDALDAAVSDVAWLSHVRADGTLAVDVAASAGVDVHTRYAAQRTKDAICDSIRAVRGIRPSVDTESPDLSVHVHLGREGGTVSVDLAGGSMHRRGYRVRGALAPLKETLAAAILGFSRWEGFADEGRPLVDPMCGSGTLLVEGGLIAADVAPGTLRRHHPVERWLGHEANVFARELRELVARAEAGRASMRSRLFGYDASADAIEATSRALSDVGLLRYATLERAAIEHAAAPRDTTSGLVVVNPPYGERLGHETELALVYETLGDVLRRSFRGFDAWVLTSSATLAKRIGLRASERVPLFNGPIECRLLHFPIAIEAPKSTPAFRRVDEEAKAFENRLRKNQKTIEKRALREGLEVYRLYDADIPEYNVAVDRYRDHVVVQEYAAPRHVDPDLAARRLRDSILVVREVLELSPERLHLAVRKRQTSGAQYERSEGEGTVFDVHEGDAVFEVRLGERLDTGVFADHRILRREIAKLASGKRLLNLFAYTCTASVVAARSSARTTSVDLSQTYLDWGARNFDKNRIPLRDHRLVRADCLGFLEQDRNLYDVVFVNPPSYSRSHRMDSDFSVVRDQASLVRAAFGRVAPGGVVVFSTHARGFELDPVIREAFRVEDISKRSVPFDFERSPHRAFLITRS